MSDSTKLSEALEWWKPHTPTRGRSEASDDWESRYRDWMEDAGVISAAAQKFLALLPDEDGNHNPELLGCLDGKGYPDLYEFSDKQVEAIETLGLKMIPVKNAYVVRNVLDAITGNTE